MESGNKGAQQGPAELCKSDAVSSYGTQNCAVPDAEPLPWKMYTRQRLTQSDYALLTLALSAASWSIGLDRKFIF